LSMSRLHIRGPTKLARASPAGQGCSHILSSKKGRSQSESRSTLARLTTLARGDRCSHSTSY
jgi:hypothetical protein